MRGRQAVLAYDGQQALALAHESNPDVFLLDLGLPDNGGYEVCAQLRKNPEFATTLIVAQRGWGQDRDLSAVEGFYSPFGEARKIFRYCIPAFGLYQNQVRCLR